VKKYQDASIPVRYVMEATGVYHEEFAYSLVDEGKEVSIVLPNKISNYFRTLEVKTITDKTSAEAIMRFGLERKLDSWRRPNATFRKLRHLTRERDQIVEERTSVKNQLHAEGAGYDPHPGSLKRMKKREQLLDAQEKEIKADIASIVKNDDQLQALIIILTTIPGVGVLTAVTVLAETNGFDLIRNKRQLTSYAGLDVREKQSGTSIRGKASISKRGNRSLRKAMYFPALTAIRGDGRFKTIYANLVAKHGIKMKAAVAVQRKILELMYTLYRNNAVYDDNYQLIQKAKSSHYNE
jgi:transposase